MMGALNALAQPSAHHHQPGRMHRCSDAGESTDEKQL
jgi:hypothetical protein